MINKSLKISSLQPLFSSKYDTEKFGQKYIIFFFILKYIPHKYAGLIIGIVAYNWNYWTIGINEVMQANFYGY